MKRPLKHSPTPLEAWQAHLLCPALIFELAHETSFVQRLRKLDPVCLIYVLIFGNSSHKRPTFEEIHRRYLDFDDNLTFLNGITIQSFKKRFNQNMVDFLASLLDYYINQMISDCPARLKGHAEQFKDILIQDSSIIRISKKLAGKFPAARSRDNAAGLKIHAVYSACAHSIKSIRITGERTHDSQMIQIGTDINNVLFINDLGYYSVPIFTWIKNHGGFFVSRLKTNVTPHVISVVAGQVSKTMNQSIFDSKGPCIADFLKQAPKEGIYDLECSFEVTKEKKRSNIPAVVELFRVVCFWNEQTARWHTYVTNLPVEQFAPEDIYQLYKYRWIIELLFKELKGDYDLGELLLGNPSLAYIHIYSMLIRMIISRNLYAWILSTVEPDKQEQYGPLLWSKVFAEKCHEFLSILHQHWFGEEDVRERWMKLEESLRHLAKSRHNNPRLSQKYTTF
jgi:IS4 transposase